MGDRLQAYTSWRYWQMVAPMALQEAGPMGRQYATWGFNNKEIARELEKMLVEKTSKKKIAEFIKGLREN